MRRGFTLIELLAVVGIVGTLAALTLAGVQRVRVAAMRADCLSRLRQVALAAHSHHAAHGKFPPGARNFDSPNIFHYRTLLLPHLEREDLWRVAQEAHRLTYDTSKSPPHPQDVVVRAYTCPADGRTARPQSLPAETNNVSSVGLASYLGVAGRSSFRKDGVLFLDSQTRLADITDGATSTLLFGERPPDPDLRVGWWYSGGWSKEGDGGLILGTREQNNHFPGRCAAGYHEYGPGDIENPCSQLHFWSPHVNGAHFALADGSARLIAYPAAPLMPALATRAGGDPVVVPE